MPGCTCLDIPSHPHGVPSPWATFQVEGAESKAACPCSWMWGGLAQGTFHKAFLTLKTALGKIPAGLEPLQGCSC